MTSLHPSECGIVQKYSLVNVRTLVCLVTIMY